MIRRVNATSVRWTCILAISASIAGQIPADASPIAHAVPVVAQQVQLPIIDALRAEGYRVTSVRRTFLGRIRVVIQNENHIREVVVSRSTGEVKSDQVMKIIVTDADGKLVAVSPGQAERAADGQAIGADQGSGVSNNGNSGSNSNGKSGSNSNGKSGSNGNGNSGGNGNGNGNGNSGGNGNGNSGGNGNGNSGGNGNGKNK